MNFEILELVDADQDAVIALWDKSGLTRPWNDPVRDIAFARANNNSTILVGRISGSIVASIMVGHDGHRGAVYYLSVDPSHRGQGHGRSILNAAQNWLRAQGVWKLNLLVRADNETVIGFYEGLGFETTTNAQLEKRLDQD